MVRNYTLTATRLQYNCPWNLAIDLCTLFDGLYPLEGLLLLISLTESNADLQKIVAFENAFERLLAIIDEEGAISGGIIVQDCLQLVQNLLRYNVSNQVLWYVFF
jgi:hypothetical protein